MSDSNIGDTVSPEAAQESCVVVIPVKVPASTKDRLTKKAGKGKVSPYVRALIERDLAA